MIGGVIYGMMKHIGHGQDAVIILERRCEMLVYISGAITNDPNYKDKFAKAEKYLTDKGHTVINPAKVAESLPELEHEQYMRIDKAMIDSCDAVYFLKDWEQSKGAREEYLYALSNATKLIFEGDNEDEL
jgi:nucleoside 2-deoxyribosyltransferase